MAFNCGVSFALCAVRLTEVDDEGNAGGQVYVTDKPLEITLTPNIEAGESTIVRNGCGCSIARFRQNDTFNWFEFSFQTASLEPEMIGMLLGSDTISNGADEVGVQFGGALECDATEPAVGFEFWTKHIVGSGPDGTYPWFHWVFPKTVWQLADNTFNSGAATPTLNGFSRTNQRWGSGPHGDGPPDGSDVVEGAFYATATDPPVAACASTTVAPGS